MRVVPRVISLIVGQPSDVPEKHAVGFRVSLSVPTMSHTTPCEPVGYMSLVKPAPHHVPHSNTPGSACSPTLHAQAAHAEPFATRCARHCRYAGPGMPLVGPNARAINFLLMRGFVAVGPMPDEKPHRTLSSSGPRQRVSEMAQAYCSSTAAEHDEMSVAPHAMEDDEATMANAVGFNPEDFAEEQMISLINTELRVAFPFVTMSKKQSGVVDRKMMFKFNVARGIGPSGGGRHAYACFVAGSLSITQIGEVTTAVHSGVLDHMAEHEFPWTKQVRCTCAFSSIIVHVLLFIVVDNCPHLF